MTNSTRRGFLGAVVTLPMLRILPDTSVYVTPAGTIPYGFWKELTHPKNGHVLPEALGSKYLFTNSWGALWE